jgi:hypothetical protein
MTRAALVAAIAALSVFAQNKSLPNQAGNGKLGLVGTAITDRKEITQLLGFDLGEGFVVVKIRMLPQTLENLRVAMDDFTLVSRKDGEKSGALVPSQMYGGTALVVGRAQSSSGNGIGTARVPTTGGSSGSIGTPGAGGIGNTGSTESGMAEARIVKGRSSDDPRIEPLEAKGLRTVETKEPVEGLLYFFIERNKVKPKDLGLIYAGPAGRLVVDFK